MSTKYIGEKEVKTFLCDESLCEVEYVDGGKEALSKPMFDEVVADEKCDLTTLRDKRVRPVVAHVLSVMRGWGLKLGEVGYFSQLLNQSLQANEDIATQHLWKSINSTIKELDDISMVDVDIVLKSIKPEAVPSPYGDKDTSK